MSKYSSFKRDTGMVDGFNDAPVPPSSNLFGWWSASEAYSDTSCTTLETVDGNPIRGLKDLSGNGRNLTRTAGGDNPTYKTSQQNGFPSLRFDGSNDYMSRSGMSNNTALCIYMVVRQLAWTNSKYFFYVEGASHYGGIYQDTTSPNLQAFTATPSGNSVTNNNLSVGSFGLVSMIVNGASSSFVVNNIASNGTLGSTVDLTSIYLGGTSSGTNYANVDVCELLIYSAAHSYSTGEGLGARKYLNNKYGLMLSL